MGRLESATISAVLRDVFNQFPPNREPSSCLQCKEGVPHRAGEIAFCLANACAFKINMSTILKLQQQASRLVIVVLVAHVRN